MPFLAYFAAMLIAAASVAFGLDLLSSPLPPANPKLQAARQVAHNAAPNPVRQIPIGRADVNNADTGDPKGALSPIYPASPGGALKNVDAQPSARPVKAQPANTEQPQAVAAEPAIAPPPAAQTAALQAPIAAPNATPITAPNSCNVAACAGAYKSFRAADCTYQPFEGPRRLCENPGEQQQQIASQPRSREPAPRERSAAPSPRDRNAELEDVVRSVKRLSPRDTIDDDDRTSGVVVLDERGGAFYGARPRWVIGR